MTRRLVLLDDESKMFTEIDAVKLRRVAIAFRFWLKAIDPQNDPFRFLSVDLPLVENALNGSLPLPYRGGLPHRYEMHEGLLPNAYLTIAAPFYVTILGMHDVPPEIIEIGGRKYAYKNFEDPNGMTDG